MLHNADRVGFIGSVDADWPAMTVALSALARHDVQYVFQLGDLGALPLGNSWARAPEELQRSLAAFDQRCLFLDGRNDPPQLRQLHATSPHRTWPRHEVRWLTGRLGYLPRAYRSHLGRLRFAAFGGADTDEPDRAISEDDVEAFGIGSTNLLMTHLRPLDEPGSDDDAGPTAARSKLHEVFLAGRPRVLLAGGPAFSSRTFAYRAPRGTFVCRVVTMPPVGGPDVVASVMDTAASRITFLDANGAPVVPPTDIRDLTGQESGRYLLRTETSQHVLDLDARRWTRLPGPSAPSIGTANQGRLRSYDDCTVGKCGYITTFPERSELHLDHHWARTSLIRSIEVLPKKAEKPDGNNPAEQDAR